jgi:hypothetical protein
MRKLVVLCLTAWVVYSCANLQKFDYSVISDEKEEIFLQNQIDSVRMFIEMYHPNPYGSYSKGYIDSIIKNEIYVDDDFRMTMADWTLKMKKVVDLYGYNDPHIVLNPLVHIEEFHKDRSSLNANRISVLPFDIIQINDTILIDRSYDSKLVKGDRLLRINDIGKNDFPKYIDSKWRFFPAYLMQQYYQRSFSDKYIITVERAGQIYNLTVRGIAYGSYRRGERYIEQQIINKYKTGYFRINEFKNNTASEFFKFVKSVKNKEFNNIIIDIRNNPGGTGKDLYKLLSIMSDKDSIYLRKSQYIKVSDVTIEDYNFLKETQVGELVKMADSLTYKKIRVDREYFQPEMNYYIMASKSTGSTAAGFVNIVQYNNLGKIVGESLLHNAHVYGDIYSNIVYQRLVVSTMQYNEYTKAENGIIKPDIFIPFVASEYMDGGEPVLEKCLEYINKH